MALLMRGIPPKTTTISQITYNLDWLQKACQAGQYLVCDNLIIWFISHNLFPFLANDRWHIPYEDVLPWLDISTMNRRLELVNRDLKLQLAWGKADLFLWKMLSHEIANHRIWLHFNAFNICFDHEKRQYSHLEGPLVAHARKKR